MRRAPRVSVIMNCRNGEPFVGESVSSVLRQTWEDLEIVFWDNLSTDRSAEIVRDLGGDRLHYFQSPSPLMLGDARNRAIAEARGELVAFLDVDDRWLPDKLTRQLERLAADPDAGVVYTDMLRIEADGRPIVRYSTERALLEGRVVAELTADCFISICTALVPRAALEQSGLFDPRFMMVEDWDLFLRLAEHRPVALVPEVLVEERLHGSNTSRDYQRMTDEIITLLQEWGARRPELASVCRRGIEDARFRLAGVRSFQAMRGGQPGQALRQAADGAWQLLRHPSMGWRIARRYLRGGNLKVFAAKFS